MKTIKPSDADRLLDRLVVGASGCQEWSGARDRGNYGQIGFNGKVVLAHRLAWQMANGAIPDGLLVLHRCDNPPCCNPAHLFLGTTADNMADMVSKGRCRSGVLNRAKTHCAKGHPYDDSNTYRDAHGWRHCRTCRADAVVAHDQRRRDAKHVEAA